MWLERLAVRKPMYVTICVTTHTSATLESVLIQRRWSVVCGRSGSKPNTKGRDVHILHMVRTA